jgi:hypothetical protein
MTANDFRRIALSMDGAVESAHMNHPDFRADGKIFATIYPDGKRGMVKLTPDLQREYLRAHPLMFEPASGAWGRQGCTTVLLASADAAIVRAAMTHARRSIPKKTARKTRTKRR